MRYDFMFRRQCNASLVHFAGTLVWAGLCLYAVWACYTLCSSAGGLSRAAFWTEGEVRMDSPSYWASRFTLGASVITLRMQSPVFHTLQQHSAGHCSPLSPSNASSERAALRLTFKWGLAADPKIGNASDIALPDARGVAQEDDAGWRLLCTSARSAPRRPSD